ncbi:alpha/beta fold hydrolase [bacterium]|nr:MAG: alpha/beta fold hydrolase [bacterium]
MAGVSFVEEMIPLFGGLTRVAPVVRREVQSRHQEAYYDVCGGHVMGVVSVHGGELYFDAAGDGEVCVTIHGGFGFDHTSLSPWLDPLASAMRVIYYDHRGCGRSSRIGMDALTVNQLRDDVDAVREHVGAERVTLFGHGWGSCVALEYALAYPERVKRLILVSGIPSFPVEGEMREAALQRGTIDAVVGGIHNSGEDDDALARAIGHALPLLFYDVENERVQRLFSHMLWSAPAALQWRRIFDGWSVRQSLAKIAAPTLLLAGEFNTVFPVSQSMALYEGIVNSSLELFGQSGHFPFVEEPEEFFRTVFEWLEAGALA